MVPEVTVPALWKDIKDNIPEVMGAVPTLLFVEYFTKYYINGPFAGIWSHFDTKGAKTNNHVEAYNLALKKFVNYKSNLNIYEAIELLSQELYSRKKMADIALDKPNRRKQDPGARARQDMYNNLKRLWEDDTISDGNFLEAVVFSYKIIVHKTQYEIDLETEPVSDPITFDINRLISDEELPDLVL